MEDKKLILRPYQTGETDVELFIGNSSGHQLYRVPLSTQIIWIFVLLKNIMKHAKFNA